MPPPLPVGAPPAIPDATDALAQILEHHARLLRQGASREDTANTLLPIVRLATGRT